MTTNEIKAIIAEKIAGQGNQVDIGGALAEVLNAILDMTVSQGLSLPPLKINNAEFSNLSESEAAQRFGITVEQLTGLFTGRYPTVIKGGGAIFLVASTMDGDLLELFEPDDNQTLYSAFSIRIGDDGLYSASQV